MPNSSTRPTNHQITPTLCRCISIAEWLLLILVVAYAGAHGFLNAWKTINTDFPNYYLAARLVREGNNTSQIYEWIWLQRQSNYLGITHAIVSFVPITPFSTLFVWPFAFLHPLNAKHCWLLLNMVLTVATA